MIVWLILSGLSLIPLLGFAVAYRVSGRRAGPGVLTAAVLGAALGGLLASAGSAMASATNPTSALLRGAALGGMAGTTLGGVTAILVQAWRGRAR